MSGAELDALALILPWIVLPLALLYVAWMSRPRR